MKTRDLNKRLFGSFLLSLAIFIFSAVFSNERKTTGTGKNSAILNSRDIDIIEIADKTSGDEEKISLKRQGDFWLLFKKTENKSENEACAFADKKIVASLIDSCVKVRKIYKISDDEKDFSRLGLDESGGIEVCFSKNDGKVLSRVYFGGKNSIKNRIFVRSASSKIAYETENDFSQYLNARFDYWAAGEIFSEIEKITQISFGEPENFVIDEKNPSFSYLSRSLLSLRHGRFFSSEENLSGSEKLLSTLSVQDGNGRLSRLDFFEGSDSGSEAGEKVIFFRKTIFPSEIDSQENVFAFYSQNASYEISAWTYEKIRNLILNN